MMMSDEQFEALFRLLSKAHEVCGELKKISESKFPDVDGCKADIQSYRQGWNDAIDFILNGGHWEGGQTVQDIDGAGETRAVDKARFGRKIRTLMLEAEVDRNCMADWVGVTPQTISNWARGKSAPGAVYLKRIAEVFRMKLDALLEGCYDD